MRLEIAIRFVLINKMLALQSYASSDDEDSSEQGETSPNSDTQTGKAQQTGESTAMLPYVAPINSEFSIKKQLEVCAAPLVLPTVSCYNIFYKTAM